MLLYSRVTLTIYDYYEGCFGGSVLRLSMRLRDLRADQKGPTRLAIHGIMLGGTPTHTAGLRAAGPPPARCSWSRTARCVYFFFLCALVAAHFVARLLGVGGYQPLLRRAALDAEAERGGQAGSARRYARGAA
jgi:hypothetical protein